ncbi:hypothetical protein HO928_09265 [Streptococcus suis]|nr:hypothetical protein [Streptococcus suis]
MIRMIHLEACHIEKLDQAFFRARLAVAEGNPGKLFDGAGRRGSARSW